MELTRNEGYNRHKIMVKNLTNLLLIIFIPLVTLSVLSVIVTQRYIKEEVIMKNEILLKQASQNFDLVINELDTLSLDYGVNPFMTVEIERFFNLPTLSYEDLQIFTSVKSYIDSSANAKPYVHSIYLYYSNPDNRVISSAYRGFTFLNGSLDRSWYDTFLRNQDKQGIYSEPREVQDSSFGSAQSILSIYKNLFITTPNRAKGVIVMNIRKDYMEELLDSGIGVRNEGLIIANENRIPVISYKVPTAITEQDVISFLSDDRTFFSYMASETSFTVSKYQSPKYGWTYLSVTPNKSLYQVPSRLLQISIVLFGLALVLGVLLVSYVTRVNYKSFETIIKMLDAAKAGHMLPPVTSRVKDEHGYIIQNLVMAFINQDYLKMQLSERKYRMKVLELLALQSQINPHFLYNTLHTISWKSIAITKKPNEISGMIDNLSTILKYVLSNSNEMVTLDEEIYYTMCYVNIQSVRYRNRFRVKWTYDDDNLAEIMIMKLIFQPLIENSIYHGIKEKEGEGVISVRLVRDGSFLKIWLIDNGLGMTRERLDEIREMLKPEKDTIKSDHIGLYNVNKRLLLTYGDSYRIRIKSAYGRGTAIFIKFPLY